MNYGAFDPSTMISTMSLGVTPSSGDSFAALQAAELTAHGAGKMLFINPGTYFISQPLGVQDGDVITAALNSVKIEPLKANITLLGNILDPTGETKNVTIANIIFDDNFSAPGTSSAAAPSQWGALAVFWRISDFSFVNDTFENAPYIGILLSNADHSGFSGCSFSSIGTCPFGSSGSDPYSQGIAFTSSDYKPSVGNYVASCSFSQIGLDSVSATDQTGFSVTGTSFANLQVEPSQFWTQFPAAGAGVYLENDISSTVSGCTVANASGAGIDIASDTGVSINQCIINDSNGAGINVAADSNVTINQNLLTNNNQDPGTWLSAAAITVADHAWGQAGADSSNVWIYQNVATNTNGNATQYWAVQINPQANPANLFVWNNEFYNNSMQVTYGTNGIFDGYIQPGTSTIVSAPLDTGVLATPPSFIARDPVPTGTSRAQLRSELLA
ncbi:right-handed parallel beta-helix repeat-containing protein [Acidisoma sp. C75]